MAKIYSDDRYNTKFDLSTLEDDNYVYLRCKSNFQYIYDHELTKDLYKKLVEWVREPKNKLEVVEVNDFIEYVYFVYEDITYYVKINLIDDLIKSFDYLRRSHCNKKGYPLSHYSPKNGLRESYKKY